MAEGLPKLPGYTFADPSQTKFHINHKFDFINGYRVPKYNDFGIGKKELDVNSVGFTESKDSCRYDPSLTYGRVRSTPLPQYMPHFALYDAKCLTFNAFFKQTIVESPDEHFRVRQVNIIYFLENDTITVMEPTVPNCGFKQGRMVKRGKIPKNDMGDFWHWKDFNIGIDVAFNGIVYHITDCDLFTKEYMLSQGIVLNSPENMPPDPYTLNRYLSIRPTTRKTPLVDDKLRRFLEFDGKILRFHAVWDDRDSEYGELRRYTIYYFLADDCVSVKEVYERNGGRDPFPLMLKKMKMPKNWKDRPVNYPSSCLELSDAEVSEYYQPKDLLVGETIFILGRRFFIYDCDPFTRNYFKKMLNIDQKPACEVGEAKKPPVPRAFPPHTSGLGTIEDSLQSCITCLPKRPKKDEVRLLINACQYLRYTARLDSAFPEDEIRKFIIFYSLADGTIKINEPPIRNSGIIGGKFIRSSLIPKPGTDLNDPDYYTPADFQVGHVVVVNEHRFIITGADLKVYRYMQDNPDKFPQHVIDNIRNSLYKQGLLENDIEDQMERNRISDAKEARDAIGAKLEQIVDPLEKCLANIEVHDRHYSIGKIDEPLDPYKDDKPTFERTEATKQVTPEFGITKPDMECRYEAYLGDRPKTECKEVRPKPEPPCCLMPGKNEIVEDPKERESLYYENVLAKHQDICSKTEKFYNKECPPEKHDYRDACRAAVKKESAPKTVRFSDDPTDKCALDRDDQCQLKIKKEPYNCTHFE